MFSTELVDERIFERLSTQVKNKRHASTYLFTGEELEKKKALAVGFAKILNCNERQFHLDCSCRVCERIEAGTHPDIKWYGLDPDANSIKIADVRDFKNWLSLKPYEAKTKVFIFDGADRLTAEAQNALLKSLEEPPSGNVIILLVRQARSLFDTIVSRAIEIRVPPFGLDEIEQILIKVGAIKEEAQFLGRISNGNLGFARQAHKDGWYTERRGWILALTKDPVGFLEQFHGINRRDVLKVFDFLVELFRDILVYRTSEDPALLTYSDIETLMKSSIEKHTFHRLFDFFQSISEIRSSLEENANQKLALTQAEILFSRFLGK